MNNSTALIGVEKSGQLGLKGRSIPHMELLLFYKKGIISQLHFWCL
jgi:hypothetical protein